MKTHRADIILSSALAVIAILALGVWWYTPSPFQLETRQPGQDGSPQAGSDGGNSAGPVAVAGKPVKGNGAASKLLAEWPGFRGPKRDGINDEKVSLARSWPPQGPPVLWRLTFGEGYASPAIAHGCVYLLDYDEAAGADTMRCLSLDDGREIWRNSYKVELTRNHGISRTMPVVVGDYVISFGPRCHIACWNAKTGDCLWLMDLVGQQRAVVPRWYAGQCPLIDQDRLILAPCGDSLLIAVDYKTGKVLWKSPNPRRWEMTHVSIVPMDIQGRRTYVYCGSGGVAGVAADDGTLLWDTTSWPVQFAHAPSPLPLPDDRIFLSSGYGAKTGAMLLHVTGQGSRFGASVAAEFTPQQFNSEQQTPILFRGHIFGVRKRGGGQLVCMDLQGKEIWNSGADRFGHGPYMIADNCILAMDNNGRLVLAEAKTDSYQRLASFQAIEDGHDAWGPMSLAGGRLILRDLTRMACLDIASH
jgi:outer membrane protein assembly factor BamB